MNVHNLMEDIVIKAVNTLYDRVKGENVAWLTCDCENCRLDTVSYYAVATGNDAIDSNGNMYLNGGYVFCCGSEEGLDANSEGGYTVYIQNGTNLMAVGGNMGAIESGASISQTCYQGTASANTWYALYSGSNVAFAAYTPTFSNQGGMGPGGGGGYSSSKTIVVTAPSTPKLYSGVTASGTTFWTGKGATNATGGSQVSLSSYSGGGGWGPNW